MGWDGCRGGPGTDPDGLGWYGMSGMGLEQWFLNWVRSNPRGSVSQFQGFGGLVLATAKVTLICSKYSFFILLLFCETQVCWFCSLNTVILCANGAWHVL